ncbi:Guanine nucleotide-binding protein subunit gamma 1 [Rhynchospora pubera]|uniref:Guanine nucleotide-binding protein subunit gamma 1 n=1 Tax=Rhynchospora pubera TaxID=906938 RepID=A0AAV8BY77_9POAL|nr:Guanine nucleotide-binding protein subunit gamma 1 [Rhynchospora pubera]
MEASGKEATSNGWRDPQSESESSIALVGVGKHRISVQLKRLQQETRFLEEELQELEKTDKVSAGLQESIYKIESCPDPLLPITTGPANPIWDQWFERPKQKHRCRCWLF